MQASIVIVALTLCVTVSVGFSDDRDLKLVHIIFRHGIRPPVGVETYPLDPYNQLTFFPVVTGERKLYSHGQFLRNRYEQFLGDHYSSDLFYIHATDVDITGATAQCISAGLWSPSDSLKLDPWDWLTFPVNYEPFSEDMLLLVRKPCPQYNLELDRISESPEIKEKLASNQELFNEISRLTGKSMKTFEDAQDIYTILMSEEALNLTLPSRIRYYYPERLLEPAQFAYVLNAYNTKLNRLKGGVFLKKLINDWENVREGIVSPKERKGFLYVGHDSTIANLLSTLKVWDPQIPGFAINILMELSQDRRTGELGVELFLRNSTEVNGPVHQLQIPECELFCPLSKLIELTREVIPQNWEEECKSDDSNYVSPPPGVSEITV